VYPAGKATIHANAISLFSNTTQQIHSLASLTYLINYFYPMVFGCYIMVGNVVRGRRGHGHDS
jgi:Na+-driven multidrug efflux pump